MSKTHRLTPEQWESIERYADDNTYDACFLELRARIEALEAAQQLHTFTAYEVAPIVVPLAKPPADAQQRTLVERMARAIGGADGPIPAHGSPWTPEARAAIHEVAAWLRSECPRSVGFLAVTWADLLDNEAGR